MVRAVTASEDAFDPALGAGAPSASGPQLSYAQRAAIIVGAASSLWLLIGAAIYAAVG